MPHSLHFELGLVPVLCTILEQRPSPPPKMLKFAAVLLAFLASASAFGPATPLRSVATSQATTTMRINIVSRVGGAFAV